MNCNWSLTLWFNRANSSSTRDMVRTIKPEHMFQVFPPPPQTLRTRRSRICCNLLQTLPARQRNFPIPTSWTLHPSHNRHKGQKGYKLIYAVLEILRRVAGQSPTHFLTPRRLHNYHAMVLLYCVVTFCYTWRHLHEAYICPSKSLKQAWVMYYRWLDLQVNLGLIQAPYKKLHSFIFVLAIVLSI